MGAAPPESCHSGCGHAPGGPERAVASRPEEAAEHVAQCQLRKERAEAYLRGAEVECAICLEKVRRPADGVRVRVAGGAEQGRHTGAPPPKAPNSIEFSPVRKPHKKVQRLLRILSEFSLNSG